MPSTAVAETRPAVVMCDEPGCTREATVSYVWPWGATGAVCAHHQIIRKQAADNIKRQIQFVPLNPTAAPPVERAERVQLHAARLAAEDELKEAQGRTSKLYGENQVLVAELQKQQLLRTEAEEKLALLRREFERLEDDHITTLRELGTARDEVVRLQTLCDALQGSTVAKDPAGE